MRKLQTKDVFKLARILKNGNITEELEKIYADGAGANTEQMGIKIISAIMNGCSDEAQENAIYELIGDVTGKTPAAIASEELDELIADIKGIAEKNDLMAFFGNAQQLA